MTLISQNIPHLLGGVSQKAPRQRNPSRGKEQINGLSSLIRGLGKRPPTDYATQIKSSAMSPVFEHIWEEDLDDRYRILVENGDLKLLNADTNVELPVEFPQGKSYLSGTDFRAVSVEGRTFLVNRSIEVAKDLTELAFDPKPQAVVSVEVGVYETDYSIYIDDYEVQVTHTTGASGSADDTATIAAALITLLEADTYISNNFYTHIVGSSIYLHRKDGKDFTVRTWDGEGDEALHVVKGSVQIFSDLPRRALNGFISEVRGDPSTDDDNFWVQYRDLDNPTEVGVWEEVPKPGTPIALDASTMPHAIEEYTVKGEDHHLYPTSQIFVSPNYPKVGGVGFNDINRYWPENAEISWEEGGTTTSFTYTLPKAMLGYEALHELGLLIDNSEDFVVSSWEENRGVLYIEKADGSDMNNDGAGSLLQSQGSSALQSGQFFDPDLKLQPDILVGLTLNNDTDGSSGTITGNDINTITVDSLTGGTDNSWDEDDEVTLVGDAPWVFHEVNWEARRAGTGEGTSVPFPSIVGKKIADVFTHSGRLGFVAGPSVVFSAADSLTRLFRQSAVQQYADDPIDAQAAALRARPSYHSVVEWHGGLFAISETVQVIITGDPILTPSTIAMDVVGRHENTQKVEPLVLGDRLFMIREKPSGAQVKEFWLNREGNIKSLNITELVPSYIEGTPMKLVGDGGLGILVVLTDSPSNSLYPCVLFGSGEDAGYSWSRWDFPLGASIESVSFLDTELAIISNYNDGAHLETMDLDIGLPDRTETRTSGFVVYKDASGDWAITDTLSKDEAAIIQDDTGGFSVRDTLSSERIRDPEVVEINGTLFLETSPNG